MNTFETKSSMDGFVWAVTIGFFALGVFVGTATHSPWILSLFVLIAIVSFGLNPTRYRVDGAALRIRRPIGTVEVPLADIQRVERLVHLPYIRLFGIGGLFGYYGLYWSKATGVVRMYGRNRRTPLLIVLRSGKQIVIMPDDPTILESFVKS